MDCLSEELAKTNLTTTDSFEEQDNLDHTDRENVDTKLCANANNVGNANNLSQTSIITSQPTSISTSSSRKTSTTSSNSIKDRNLTTEQEYTQFFYDKIDSDPNFINLVEQLSEIFPTFSKTDLKIRLKLNDNVEQLIEELFIECEQNELLDTENMAKEEAARLQGPSHSEEPTKQGLAWYQKPSKPGPKLQLSKYIVETCQLQEIFPHLSSPLIEQVLIKRNGDMDAASVDLLDPGSIETKGDKSQANAWENNTDLMHRLKIFLNISDSGTTAGQNPTKRVLEDEEIQFHIRKCRQDYSETLKSIIINCRPKVQHKVTVRDIGGRVQRGGSRTTSRSKTEYRLTPSTYKYKANRAESLELQQMYLNNEELQMLDESVLINALEFYEGDCDKVLQFAIEVLSNRSVEQLPTVKYSLGIDSKNKLTKQSTSNGIKPTHGEIVYQNLVESFTGYSAKRRQSSLNFLTSITTKDISKYVSGSKVDLHGKTALEALTLTRKVLDAWWQEEIEQRIEHGKLNLYGSLAVFVDNLLIITGRGIHSVNGISIVRRYVKDYLVRNRYVFDERVGNFEIKGMRKR